MQRITGSVFDIVHPNERETFYWRAKVISYTEQHWKKFMLHMRDSGLDTMVLLSAMANGKALFPRHPFLNEYFFDDDRDRIRESLEAADEAGISIFLPLGHQEKYSHEVLYSEEAVGRTMLLAEEFLRRYQDIPSFQGWYLADEFGFDKHGAFNEEPLKFTAGVSKELKKITPDRPRMTSPYFHPGCGLPVLEKLTEQLEYMDIDALCVQDGANNKEISAEYFRIIKEACTASKTELWANIELFNWENGSIYNKTPLIPADFQDISERIVKFSPFADKMICYQLMGLMNNLGLGKEPDASELWKKYMEKYLKK